MKSTPFTRLGLFASFALLPLVGCGGGGGGGGGSFEPDADAISDEGTSNMVSVPAGEAVIGYKNKKMLASMRKASRKKESARNRRVEGFQIDKYEVTLHNYWEFYKQLDKETKKAYRPKHQMAPSHPYWSKGRYKKGKGNYPVTGIPYEAAEAYAQWRGKRLPTRYEWEYAARGTEGNMWTNGDTFDATRYNVSASWPGAIPELVAVNSERNGKDRSATGAIGMGGNASEWATTTQTASFNVADDTGKVIKGERQTLRLHAICGPNYNTQSDMDCLLAKVVHMNPKPTSLRDRLLVELGFRCAK